MAPQGAFVWCLLLIGFLVSDVYSAQSRRQASTTNSTTVKHRRKTTTTTTVPPVKAVEPTTAVAAETALFVSNTSSTSQLATTLTARLKRRRYQKRKTSTTRLPITSTTSAAVEEPVDDAIPPHYFTFSKRSSYQSKLGNDPFFSSSENYQLHPTYGDYIRANTGQGPEKAKAAETKSVKAKVEAPKVNAGHGHKSHSLKTTSSNSGKERVRDDPGQQSNEYRSVNEKDQSPKAHGGVSGSNYGLDNYGGGYGGIDYYGGGYGGYPNYGGYPYYNGHGSGTGLREPSYESLCKNPYFSYSYGCGGYGEASHDDAKSKKSNGGDGGNDYKGSGDTHHDYSHGRGGEEEVPASSNSNNGREPQQVAVADDKTKKNCKIVYKDFESYSPYGGGKEGKKDEQSKPKMKCEVCVKSDGYGGVTEDCNYIGGGELTAAFPSASDLASFFGQPYSDTNNYYSGNEGDYFRDAYY